MSDNIRILKSIFGNLKEAVEAAMRRLEVELEWSQKYDKAKEVTASFEISPGESLYHIWTSTAATSSFLDHCSNLKGVEAAYKRLQELRYYLFVCYNAGLFNGVLHPDFDAHLRDMEQKLYDLKEVLEPLCKLQKQYEAFCELYEAYGG